MEIATLPTAPGSKRKEVRTPFIPGNKIGVGVSKQKHICTRALLAQLNSVDKKTKKEKVWRLTEQLLELALGYDYEEETIIKGKKVMLKKHMPPDLQAIIAVMDRVDGKPKQQVEARVDLHTETVYRTANDVRDGLVARGIPVDEIFNEARKASSDGVIIEGVGEEILTENDV